MLVGDNPQLTFKYVRSHTGSSDNPSTLNSLADKLVAGAHADPFTQFSLLPTFTFDCYLLWIMLNLAKTPAHDAK